MQLHPLKYQPEKKVTLFFETNITSGEIIYFLLLFLNQHQIMVSHRTSLQKSFLIQCKLLFINTPFPGQFHSDQVNILGWGFFGGFFVCLVGFFLVLPLHVFLQKLIN